MTRHPVWSKLRISLIRAKVGTLSVTGRPQGGRCYQVKQQQLKSPSPPQHPQKTFCSSEGWSSSPAQASTTLRLSPTSSFKLFSGTAREPGLWGLSQTSEQWFPLSPPQHVFSSSHRLLGGRHHLLHLGRLGPLSGARHPKRRNRQQQKSRKLLLGRGDLY